jgi:RimJ/RimL family protein N-acetyltransferase
VPRGFYCRGNNDRIVKDECVTLIPILETERLILRDYRLEDFPSHAAIWADPRTTRDFRDAFKAFDEELCWLRFLRSFGQWQLFGYGWWGLEEKTSGHYIGSVGFFHAKRAMDIPYRDLPEAGWLIAPDLHGKGLATEAMRAALAWADANIPAPESWCMIGPKNIPSQKVADRFGYRRAADAQYNGEDVLTYLRPRGG